jgi:DNA mismatch repair protein PMS2
MIGMDLDMKTMKKVVNNLSSLESPWNCPHGRPTMRLLKKLENPENLKETRSPPKMMKRPECL